jgi:hypothetical protein
MDSFKSFENVLAFAAGHRELSHSHHGQKEEVGCHLPQQHRKSHLPYHPHSLHTPIFCPFVHLKSPVNWIT